MFGGWTFFGAPLYAISRTNWYHEVRRALALRFSAVHREEVFWVFQEESGITDSGNQNRLLRQIDLS